MLKMVETKTTITVSALSGIMGVILALGGVTLFSSDLYYCEDRSIMMQCDSLSKYYGLENGKCWNEKVGNKLCTSGWLEVIDDTYEIPTNGLIEEPVYKIPFNGIMEELIEINESVVEEKEINIIIPRNESFKPKKECVGINTRWDIDDDEECEEDD